MNFFLHLQEKQNIFLNFPDLAGAYGTLLMWKMQKRFSCLKMDLIMSNVRNKEWYPMMDMSLSLTLGYTLSIPHENTFCFT